jgi:hypothetical protein
VDVVRHGWRALQGSQGPGMKGSKDKRIKGVSLLGPEGRKN